jgi:hypothetical protein
MTSTPTHDNQRASVIAAVKALVPRPGRNRQRRPPARTSDTSRTPIIPAQRKRMGEHTTVAYSSPAPAARCTSGMRKKEWPRCAAGAGKSVS